ncbi:MAG: Ig-like domain-containing protein [Thermoplasmatota archaeon]
MRRFVIVLAAVALATSLAPLRGASARSPTDLCPGFAFVPGQGPSCRDASGLWEITLADGTHAFTHGPDPSAGLVGADGVGVDSTPRAPVCVSDPTTQYHMRVIYAVPSDKTDRYASVVANIRDLVNVSNGRLHDEATPFGRDLDYKVRCTGALVDVADVVLPTASGADSFNTITSDLRAKGYTSIIAKYWVWYDDDVGPGIAGQGNLYTDDSLALGNLNNAASGTTATFAVEYGGIAGFGSRTWMHENGHNLGAVQNSAPNTSGAGHCNDGLDVMCYADGGPDSAYNPNVCTDFEHFDCNHDDYFNPAPAAGSYLATHWNIGSTLVRFIQNLGADLTPPTASITTPTTGSTQPATFSVSFTAADDIGVDSASLGLDGTFSSTGLTCTPALSATTTSTTCTKSLTFTASGTHTLVARGTDASGKSGDSPSVSVTVDVSPPTATITAPLGTVESAPTLTVNATVTDNSALDPTTPGQWKLDGGSYTAMTCTGAAASKTCTAAWSLPTLGAHSLTVLATDAVGNTATGSASVNVVDTFPPSVVLTSPDPNKPGIYIGALRENCPVPGCFVLSGTNIAVNANGWDAGSGITSAKVYLDGVLRVTMGGTSANCRTATAPCALSGQFNINRPFDDGPRTLRVDVTDGAGHTTSASLAVVVV